MTIEGPSGTPQPVQGPESFELDGAVGPKSEPYIEIEGTRAYGEPLGAVTQEQISRFNMSPVQILHLARRFSAEGVGEEFISSLVGRAMDEDFGHDGRRYVLPEGEETEITRERIELELSQDCSKFSPAVPGFENPVQAISSIKAEALRLAKAGELDWVKSGSIAKAYIRLQLDGDVGTYNKVDFEKLTDQAKARIDPKGENSTLKYQGEDFYYPTLEVSGELPTSREVWAVIIAPLNESGQIAEDAQPKLVTAWVGPYVTAGPSDVDQSAEESAYYADFHSRHAKLVINDSAPTLAEYLKE